MSDEMKVERYGPRGMYVRHIDFERLQQQLAAAREALQAAEADAARYRWLREARYNRWQLVRDWCEEELDDAIDATLQRDRKP